MSAARRASRATSHRRAPSHGPRRSRAVRPGVERSRSAAAVGTHRPRALILRTAGTNCDAEAAWAFELAGAETAMYHINQLVESPRRLQEWDILVLPGGFTYGDDVASGKILANELRHKLFEPLCRFIQDGKLVIGICNGFQALVKSGFLPNSTGDHAIEASLFLNDSGRFEDRWVRLQPRDAGRGTRKTTARTPSAPAQCVWTRGISRTITMPVAHGEGKFVTRDDAVRSRLRAQGQIAFQYVDEQDAEAPYPWNPNGSVDGIAGVCDPTGRVLGMMPHPERHVIGTQSPVWTRARLDHDGDGLAIFRNGVSYARAL